MNKFFNNEQMPTNRSNSEVPKPNITETIQNNLYFYADVERETILTLNRDLLNLKNDLLHRSIVTNHTVTPIYLHIQSYGGNLLSGFSAMDTVLKMKENIPIYTIVDGFCASASTLMSIVGTKRYIKPSSYILIHQLSAITWGNFEQIKDDMENMTKFMKALKDIYRQHTKIPMKKLDEILKHDLWFNAEEALQYGLVDSIL